MKIIYKDGHVDECPQDQELHVIRHTAAHVMAQAIKRLYPEADFAFGPATENGFYYDVDLGDTKLTDEDLANIEKEMHKITKENLAIKPFILPRAEAVKLMEERHENYKVEHMADLADETEFSFFQQGEYVDMCIGPHLTYTKALKAFKITQQSGAYWKNDKENKMLTRINGVAFHNQEELDAWEKEQQEARERDHRKIGKEMGLFMTDDLVGRGLPMFLPAGYTVWQELENYIKEKERARGYLHVMTPCIGTVNLYKTSGHWDHYRENMFPAMEMEGESYVLRPMNCPHHMMIYANRPHSYRDLPMRIGEIAHDFRYESSGTLKGIERGRHFCQNDAHLFCTPEQIKSEVADVCNLIFETYKDFNITDYRCVLSLRDPADKKKYHDDDAMWNHAENALREVLTELFTTLGDMRDIMTGMAYAAQFVALCGVMLVGGMAVSMRQRMLGTLRVLGAPRAYLVLSVWCVVSVSIAVGTLAGLLFGCGLSEGAALLMFRQTGIMLSPQLTLAEGSFAAASFALGSLCALFPAYMVYRKTGAVALGDSE